MIASVDYMEDYKNMSGGNVCEVSTELKGK